MTGLPRLRSTDVWSSVETSGAMMRIESTFRRCCSWFILLVMAYAQIGLVGCCRNEPYSDENGYQMMAAGDSVLMARWQRGGRHNSEW